MDLRAIFQLPMAHAINRRRWWLRRSRQEQMRRLQLAGEWIEHEAENLQRHDAEQWLIARLAEDDRRVAFALGEHQAAFGNLPLDGASVRESERRRSPRPQADLLPIRLGDQRVHRAAVDEETDRHGDLRRSAHLSFDVRHAHGEHSTRGAPARTPALLHPRSLPWRPPGPRGGPLRLA